MKCPFRYNIAQVTYNTDNYNSYTENDTNIRNSLFIENQNFAECYQEDCAAWNKETKICKKLNI